MFQRLSHLVVRFRWAVLVLATAIVLAGLIWGIGVFGALSNGGYTDPGSESVRAANRIAAEIGRQDADLIALYSSKHQTVNSEQFQNAVREIATRLRSQPEVEEVISYYDLRSRPETAPNASALVANNQRATYLVIRLHGDEEDRLAAYTNLRPLAQAQTLKTQLGGEVVVNTEINEQISTDIVRAEIFSIPIVLILLLFIFGSVIAAMMPLVIAGISIMTAFSVTRLLTTVTDVSNFAINVITIFGLGLAIDYALFIVSRFREETADNNRTIAEAVRRTMMTAGRTVAVSGATLVLSLAGLLVFPIGFLRSMAFGGIAAVSVAVIAALTVLPALLVLLGRRINAWPIRLPGWRHRAAAMSCVHTGGWARLAHSVMRRPVLYVVLTVVPLVAFAVPFFGIKLGSADVSALPVTAESRTVSDRLQHDFPQSAAGGVDTIAVLVTDVSEVAASDFVAEIKQLPAVEDAVVTATKGNATIISVRYPGEATGNTAQQLVSNIRNLPSPAGATVMVAGTSAEMVDLLNTLTSNLPWMILIIVSVTLVLLFLAFGSVLLPIKAVVMNVFSLIASLGVIVWIFQQGHLTGVTWLVHTGAIDATVPILMVAILFGLSMDYEVFLLSRIREQWDRTGDNTAAVASGLQRSGKIITSAALLLVIVIAGFALAEISIIQMIGVGMIVAVIIDATLIRALLVPATMRLLGHTNWWAPDFMRHFYNKYGVQETHDLTEPQQKNL